METDSTKKPKLISLDDVDVRQKKGHAYHSFCVYIEFYENIESVDIQTHLKLTWGVLVEEKSKKPQIVESNTPITIETHDWKGNQLQLTCSTFEKNPKSKKSKEATTFINVFVKGILIGITIAYYSDAEKKKKIDKGKREIINEILGMDLRPFQVLDPTYRINALIKRFCDASQILYTENINVTVVVMGHLPRNLEVYFQYFSVTKKLNPVSVYCTKEYFTFMVPALYELLNYSIIDFFNFQEISFSVNVIYKSEGEYTEIFAEDGDRKFSYHLNRKSFIEQITSEAIRSSWNNQYLSPDTQIQPSNQYGPQNYSPQAFLSQEIHYLEKISSIQDVNLFNSKDTQQRTLLHNAALLHWEKVVTFLLSRGTAIDAKDNFGFTALHLAAFIDDLEMVKLLVGNRADINCESNGGDTALDLAERQNLYLIVEYLETILKEQCEEDTKESNPKAQEEGVSGNSHALLIGISKYPFISSQLPGAVNDTKLLKSVLLKMGFQEDNITILVDEQATRDGILKAFKKLVNQTNNDDVVVFHYSGHGSRKRNSRKGTGYDETIVPYDSGREPHPNRDIRDMEIRMELLEPLTKKTNSITLLFDSCFSSGITRDDNFSKARSVPSDETDLPQQAYTCQPGPSGFPTLSNKLENNYVLFAACLADEVAFEYRKESFVYGAWTYFLCQALLQGNYWNTRQLFELASNQLTVKFPRQHPQLEGTEHCQPFGVKNVTALRTVLVLKVDMNTKRLVLACGECHGATIGSTWDIHDSSIRPIEVLARVTLVDPIDALTCHAEVITGTLDCIKEGFVASEFKHNYGNMKQSVFVDPRYLTQRLNLGSKSLELVDTQQKGDVALILVEPRLVVGPTDIVPQLGVLSEATWVALKKDGCYAVPPHTDLKKVVNDLEKVIHMEMVLRLSNKNSNDIPVFLQLLKRNNDKWEPSNYKNGKIEYTVGDNIAFEICNQSVMDLHVSVLEIAENGAVNVLFPPNSSSTKVPSKSTISFGVKPEDTELKLALAEEGIVELFGIPPDKIELKKQQGITETYKLFATKDPHDLNKLLVQDGIRFYDTVSSEVEMLVAMAMSGVRMTVTTSNQNTWIARNTSFLVKAKQDQKNIT